MLFDVGHTILFPNGKFFYDLAVSYGSSMPFDDFAQLGARVKEKAYRENPTNPYKMWFTEWFISAGVDSSHLPAIYAAIRQRHEERNLWDTLEPSIPEVLIRLRERGFVLGVISNADGTIQQMLQDLELDDYFKCIIDSAVVGIEKPDARIFLKAARILGLTAETCVYIGDQWLIDGQGAANAGMMPVILDPFEVAQDVGCLRIRRLMDILDHIDPG
ncbi:MAG: HAD-IA family hydrolase [candidate division KSB1 bacterium]|nr:HAD-IA family hydrolase [candidate division KSB1 bacterium]